MKKQLFIAALALFGIFAGKANAATIDTRITGFKYDANGAYFPGPEVTFTVQMQAGSGYVRGSDASGNWSALQMTWDFFTQSGVSLDFSSAEVENLGATGSRAASASLVYSVPGTASSGSNGGLLQLVLTRAITGNTTTNTNRDVPATWTSYALVHIPVLSGTPTAATRIFQRVNLSDVQGGSFWGNSAASNQLLNQPFSTNAPGGPGAGAPLPIHLVSFDAKKATENRVQLNWQTSQEQGSDYFEVERSADGRTFTTSIRRMQAAGTSNSVLDYQTYDNEPLRRTNYYRLKMVDLSGKITYSEVRAVTFGDVRSYALSPNPAKDYVNVKGMNVGASIVVLNTAGQVISETKAASSTETISLSNIVPGMYYVQIVEDGAIVYNTKFTKQ